MEKLKLSAVPDDKPVRLAVELPAAVHRDLITYAEVLGRETVMHLVAMGKGVSLTSEATVATTFPEIIFPSDFRR